MGTITGVYHIQISGVEDPNSHGGVPFERVCRAIGLPCYKIPECEDGHHKNGNGAGSPIIVESYVLDHLPDDAIINFVKEQGWEVKTQTISEQYNLF